MRLSVVVPCHNERACLPLLLDALEDAARDFRLMRRPMVDAVLALPERNRFTKGLYGWVGFRTHWIAYENAERAAGGSARGFWGLVRYAAGGIVDFSSRPLVLASTAGIALCAVALLALAFVAVRAALFGDPVAGWPSLVSVVLRASVLVGLVLTFVNLALSVTWWACTGIWGYTVQNPLVLSMAWWWTQTVGLTSAFALLGSFACGLALCPCLHAAGVADEPVPVPLCPLARALVVLFAAAALRPYAWFGIALTGFDLPMGLLLTPAGLAWGALAALCCASGAAGACLGVVVVNLYASTFTVERDMFQGGYFDYGRLIAFTSSASYVMGAVFLVCGCALVAAAWHLVRSVDASRLMEEFFPRELLEHMFVVSMES